MENKTNKIYLKQSTKGGLKFHFNDKETSKHYTLRFAGNPSILLEKYRSSYGDIDGEQKYFEMLKLMNSIQEDEGLSTFVVYQNDMIDLHTKPKEDSE